MLGMQAAYQEVPPAARAALHLRVGRQLMAGLPHAQYEEQQYGILHHFNEAIHLIDDPAERLKLVKANMAAGEGNVPAFLISCFHSLQEFSARCHMEHYGSGDLCNNVLILLRWVEPGSGRL